MSRLVFADTFCYLALVNERDDAHQRAVDFSRTYGGRMMTTEWVLAEVADGLAAPHRRERLLALYELLVDDLNVTIVEASHESFASGMALYSQRADKQWSLTDCISLTTMRDRGIAEALTADKHFAQAGFTPLLA